MVKARPEHNPTGAARGRGRFTARLAWSGLLAAAFCVPAICTRESGAAEPSIFDERPETTILTRHSQSCEKCHAMDAGMSHPVGMRPSMAVPAEFPLENGTITCTTCHEAREHDRAGMGPMLRNSTGMESMCTQCHGKATGSASAAHGAGTERAHLGTKAETSGNSEGFGASAVDRESRSCMACHDGALAVDVGVHVGTGKPGSGSPKEHPIGVVYKSRPDPVDPVTLVDRRRLDHRVRLFNETVGCGSCHSVYSGQEKLLVMSNQASRLCLSCHVE